MIIPYWTCKIVQLDSFYITDSPLSVTNVAELAQFHLNWPDLMIIPHRTGQIVKLECFYVTDSPLSGTNIAELN